MGAASIRLRIGSVSRVPFSCFSVARDSMRPSTGDSLVPAAAASYWPFWMVARAASGHETLRALPWLSSAYAYDVLRLLFYLAAILVIFWRVGEHMERLSGLRQSARPT